MKKNIENSDAPTSSPTMFAPVSVRSRKIRKGTSGAFERSSITTNAPISAAETASRPIVWAEPQPALDRVDERVDQQREAGGDA